MQRTFVAITLALTLSCALAVFTPTNYVKTPAQVIQDGETNFTNATNGTYIALASIVIGELDIYAPTYTPNAATPANTSANSWGLIYRKLDGKALTGNANTTSNFTAPAITEVSFFNGYAITIKTENDAGTNNIPQVVVYQIPINGGNALARITLSTNGNNVFTPSVLAQQAIGKNVYVFYLVNNTNNQSLPATQVNVTSFTIGSATKGSLEFNLTTTYTAGLQVTWGEALGNNQVYANWQEGTTNTVLRYTTVDVTKGTYNATATAASWNNASIATAFSTDKKWYGELFSWTNTTNTDRPIYYSIRFNSSAVLPFNSQPNVTLFANTSTVTGLYSYGPYLALIYTDAVTTAGSKTYSYELWNLDSLTTFKNKTTFLVTDVNTNLFKVTSGGLYTLSYNTNTQNATSNHFSNIQVGLVLGASYLTSVLGFIMTIVAGVLLF